MGIIFLVFVSAKQLLFAGGRKLYFLNAHMPNTVQGAL